MLEKETGISNMAELENKELEVLRFFHKIRQGQILSKYNRNKPLKAGQFAKVLKTFWHWHQRKNRKQGRDIRDITAELDSRDEKPKFNYFTIDDLKKICNEVKYKYRILMMFLFDSGIRAPTELMNVRTNDLEWNTQGNCYTLNIR
ncbi:MAG: hypothetical protein QXG00_04930 [Candidatus Woesearchaeota archaeon]